jgi:Putative Zn-dependent protease, contains TPR repeats
MEGGLKGLNTIVFMSFMASPWLATAQDENAALRNGNKHYRQGQYDKALPEYEKAIQQNPRNTIAQYNMGNARFRTNNYNEAQKAYDEAIASGSDKSLKERSYYNKGVTLSKQKKLQESIDAWKNALKLDPTDEDARFNLQKALNELKKQQQPRQQKQQQKQQPKKQPQQRQQNKLDKRKIEQYLKSLQQKEQEVQRKIQQNRARSITQPDKDW